VTRPATAIAVALEGRWFSSSLAFSFRLRLATATTSSSTTRLLGPSTTLLLVPYALLTLRNHVAWLATVVTIDNTSSSTTAAPSVASPATTATSAAAAAGPLAFAQGIEFASIADVAQIHGLRISRGSHLCMPNSDYLIPQLVISVKLLEGHEQVLLQWSIHKIPQDNANLDIILKRVRTAAVILMNQPVVGLKACDDVLPEIELEQSHQVANVASGRLGFVLRDKGTPRV
jgi:hypothetical protein